MRLCAALFLVLCGCQATVKPLITRLDAPKARPAVLVRSLAAVSDTQTNIIEAPQPYPMVSSNGAWQVWCQTQSNQIFSWEWSDDLTNWHHGLNDHVFGYSDTNPYAMGGLRYTQTGSQSNQWFVRAVLHLP